MDVHVSEKAMGLYRIVRSSLYSARSGGEVER